jgi:hypothetical protein
MKYIIEVDIPDDYVCPFGGTVQDIGEELAFDLRGGSNYEYMINTYIRAGNRNALMLFDVKVHTPKEGVELLVIKAYTVDQTIHPEDDQRLGLNG